MTKSGEKALTPKEYEKLLMKIDYLRDEVLIKLAVETGMRRSDIVDVKISNINFDERKIAFYQHKKRNIHTVYVGEKMVLLLKKYIRTLPKTQENLFGIRNRQAWNILNKYCERAGIPKRGFHSLRATGIKFKQLKGWRVEQTAKHVDDTVRTIQEHYLTPSDLEMKEITKEEPINE